MSRLHELFAVALLVAGLGLIGEWQSDIQKKVGGTIPDCNASSVDSELCNPSHPRCTLTYLKCYATPGLTLDINCVDNATGNPCYHVIYTCGNKRNADYDYNCAPVLPEK